MLLLEKKKCFFKDWENVALLANLKTYLTLNLSLKYEIEDLQFLGMDKKYFLPQY